jgi:hypothetical protein
MKQAVLMLAGVFAIATLATSSAVRADSCFSEGVRVGIIQKFSKKGTFVKSWEGEMVMDGLKARQNGGVTNVWKFSATDPQIAAAVEDAVMAGKEVAVKYCQKQFNTGSTDTDYIITKVVVH